MQYSTRPKGMSKLVVVKRDELTPTQSLRDLLAGLRKPRAYTCDGEGHVCMGDVANLVRDIWAEAELRGLHLSCWRGSAPYGRKITWAVHRGPRPARADGTIPPEDLVARIVLYQREGTTRRCTAYRKLSELLEAVLALPSWERTMESCYSPWAEEKVEPQEARNAVHCAFEEHESGT